MGNWLHPDDWEDPREDFLKQRNREEDMRLKGYLPGCLACEERYDDPEHRGPKHYASSGCESGKKPHCTCDTCF